MLLPRDIQHAKHARTLSQALPRRLTKKGEMRIDDETAKGKFSSRTQFAVCCCEVSIGKVKGEQIFLLLKKIKQKGKSKNLGKSRKLKDFRGNFPLEIRSSCVENVKGFMNNRDIDCKASSNPSRKGKLWGKLHNQHRKNYIKSHFRFFLGTRAKSIGKSAKPNIINKHNIKDENYMFIRLTKNKQGAKDTTKCCE